MAPILFMGVKCQNPETVGPKYKLAGEGLTINSFSAASSSVNFNTVGTKLGFNASFSDSVYWTITLRGLRSGAIKTIKSYSKDIDPGNPLWQWDGSHEGLYFFMRFEEVEATLTPLGSNLSMRDTITISNTKRFKDVALGDFENGLPLSGQFPTWVAGPSGAYDDGDAGAGGMYLDTSALLEGQDGKVFKFKPVQGARSYMLFGEDKNKSYFVSGIRRGMTNSLLASLPEDPSQLYLNLYVYGLGDANSKLNFGAQEDDGDSEVGFPNLSHDPKNDDEFAVQISLNHKGWKLFSFKYTDLQRAADPANGGNGNNIYQPKEISGIVFSLISSPPKNDVKVIFDFPILTIGGPFDPSK